MLRWDLCLVVENELFVGGGSEFRFVVVYYIRCPVSINSDTRGPEQPRQYSVKRTILEVS
jgi:hypothetical protein